MAERSRQRVPVRRGRYDLSAPHLYQPPVLDTDLSCDHIRLNPHGLGQPRFRECTAPNTALERLPRNRHELEPAQPRVSPTFPTFPPSPDSCCSPDKPDVADVVRLYRFEAAKRGSCLTCRTHRYATITPRTLYCTSCKQDFNCYPPQDAFLDPPLIPPKPLAERRILQPGEGTERAQGADTRQNPAAMLPRHASHRKELALVDPLCNPSPDPEPDVGTDEDEDPFSHLQTEIDTAIQKINPIATIRSRREHARDKSVSAMRIAGGLKSIQYGKEIVDLGDVRRQVRLRRDGEGSSGRDRDSGLGADIARCDVRVIKDGCDVRSNSWELDFLEQYEWERRNDGWK